MTMPLKNIRVLDFSSLLPGPLATLWLLQAGAEVIKIEHPEGGDEMRQLDALLGEPGHIFEMLNRGKRSIAINLKEAGAIEKLAPLIRESDILVEQFRPGVMERLGLGYQSLKVINPGLIYCSITGYGQKDENSGKAGHDINYQAQSGLLGLSAGRDGRPVMPSALVADIAGGSWPAVMNILLALYARQSTGEGCYLDISMTRGLDPFLFWAKAIVEKRDAPPTAGRELFTGGSPRYQIYQTRDGQSLAVGALEDRFWKAFCDAISLPEEFCDEKHSPASVKEAVGVMIRQRTAEEWKEIFGDRDLCCSFLVTLGEEEPNEDEVKMEYHGNSGELNLPLSSQMAKPGRTKAPDLGEANKIYFV